MPVKPWFPTFLYDAPLRSKAKAKAKAKATDDYARSLLGDCLEVRAQDPEGQLWCRDNYPAGYTSYGTRRALHRMLPSFRELERKIWPHVKRFAARIDMDLREADLAMTDCWVNIMSREAVHPAHTHPGAVVSGTFYVRTPDGCSGISFEDPRIDHFINVPPRLGDCRPENRQRITYPVQAGRLILFESWLKHEVTSNPTVDERVTISFNYTWV